MVWISFSITFKPNHPVTEEEIRKYGETYLSAFKNQVYQFNPEDRIYFPSFNQFWSRIRGLNATVSQSHGAAIEFVLNETSIAFEATRTNERIEVAILDGVFSRQQGLPIQVRAVRIIFVLESGVVFDWGGLCFFEVFDNATIVLVGSDWILDGVRYTNPITIKGSNMYEAWATDKAIWDANFDFRYDLAAALNASEGVREYLAYDELKDTLNDIAKKLKEDPDYGWSQLDSDLSELSKIALEKYGVTRSQFIEEVFNVIKEKIVVSKKLPLLQVEYDNNLVYTILFSFVIDLTYLIGLFINWLLEYIKKERLTSLIRIVKELDKTLAVTLVFGYFVLMAPFDYEWFTHLAIIAFQFIVLLVILTVLESGRLGGKLFKVKPNWGNVVGRASFGTVFLIIFLATTPFWVSVFFTLPSLFSSYSIVIGNVTPLSILVATIAVLAIAISQMIYTRLFG